MSYAFSELHAEGRLAAVPVGKLHGRRAYRFPVRVTVTDPRTLASRDAWTIVLSQSGADAARCALDAVDRACTTAIAIGPRGGQVKRFRGYESQVARRLLEATPPQQWDWIHGRPEFCWGEL